MSKNFLPDLFDLLVIDSILLALTLAFLFAGKIYGDYEAASCQGGLFSPCIVSGIGGTFVVLAGILISLLIYLFLIYKSNIRRKYLIAALSTYVTLAYFTVVIVRGTSGSNALYWGFLIFPLSSAIFLFVFDKISRDKIQGKKSKSKK